MLRLYVLFLCFCLVSCDAYKIVRNKELASQEERWADFEKSSLSPQSPVEVFWLKGSIPYIRAQKDRDLFYVSGAVHAHLRGGQLEIFRRLARGRLAELVGSKALPMDVFMRTVNVGKAAPEIIKNLKKEVRQYSEAFVEGINAYNKNLKKLPFDLRMMGLKNLDPWTLEDLIYVHRLMGLDVNWQMWTEQLKVLEESNLERFDTYWLKWVLPFFKSKNLNLDLIDKTQEAGSNAWAVSGDKTLSKKPLLAGDPHLGITLPNFWFFIYQESPHYKTLGVSMPTFPLPVLARTKNLAWSGTNMWGLNSHLYDLSKEEMKKSTKRKEFFKVRFGSDVEKTLLDSPWGPIVSRTDFFKSSRNLALKWSGHRATTELNAIFKAHQAKNIKDFIKAFENYGVVAINYVVADKENNIAKIHVTQLPQLKEDNDKLLQRTENEVTHYLNVFDLPQEINPTRGWVVSANDPLKGVKGCVFCAPLDRAKRISELLKKDSGKIDVKTIQKIQQDTYLSVAQDNVDFIFKNMRSLNIEPGAKIKRLGDWDFMFPEDKEEPYIYEEMVNFFAQEVFSSKNLSKEEARVLFLHESWRRKCMDFFSGFSVSLKERTLRRLNDYVEDIKLKKWGEVHQVDLSHPFSNVPLIGSFFTSHLGPYPGTIGSVFKASYDPNSEGYTTAFGANLRLIFDLADEDENYGVLLGGQDGFFKSANYEDQVDMWLKGKYIKLPFSAEAIKKAALYKSTIP